MSDTSINSSIPEARVSEALRELEALAQQLRSLVASQPPKDLLGYLYASLLLGGVGKEKVPPSKTSLLNIEVDEAQFLLEFVHAILATTQIPDHATLDESICAEMFRVAVELRKTSLYVAMIVATTSSDAQFGANTKDLLFRALSNWVLMRGSRHQVLELEFFSFALEPHDGAIRRAYGVGASELAAGIQALSDTVRTGHDHAVRVIERSMKEAQSFMSRHGQSLDDGMRQWIAERAEMASELRAAYVDLFHGGICNVSRHTHLPALLLDDLSYAIAEETDFFAPGPYCGTPFRTLPARKKPFIRLDGDHYLTDPSFARDAAYRAILYSLLGRDPEYADEFKRRQKYWSESALVCIFKHQLQGAKVFHEVYYRCEGNWVENDTLILIDGVLVLVEAKSGAAATIASPADSFERHARAMRDLIIKAYDQCRRFLEYLASADELPLFTLKEGRYEEVARIRLADYWLVLPIGLTVESYAPFSTSSKQLPGINPILGKHPFISVAIDELLVLGRFLPSTGALFHYLRVRQEAAGLKKLFLFDEFDHLGAYITKNRFCDDLISEHEDGAGLIIVDGMDSVINDYFKADDWQRRAVPAQEFPDEILNVLAALDLTRAPGWIEADSYLRDFGREWRDDLALRFAHLRNSLHQYSHRYFAIHLSFGLLFWLYREGDSPGISAAESKAQAVAESFDVDRVLLITVGVTDGSKYVTAAPHWIRRMPTASEAIRADALALSSRSVDPSAEAPLVSVPVARKPDRFERANARVAGTRSARKVGRNEPCPCGSGKKYKRCHGK